MIVKKIDRFGRNLLEILQNHKALEDTGIKLIAVKEDIQDTLFMQIKGALAEQEAKDIKERMMGGKIAKARRGILTSGRLPFARTYDEKKPEGKRWGVDDNKVEAMEWVYEEYVKQDRSLQQIAIDIEHRFRFSISYQYLVTVLKEHCGDTWEVNFEDHDETITYEVPRILSDDKIQAIKDRLAHNRTNNRTDVQNKYLLTGFIRCKHCGRSLNGQTQHDGEYKYYRHPRGKRIDCNAFSSIKLEEIESLVFRAIFEHIWDIPSWEKAIADSVPDEELIKELENDIEDLGKDIKELDRKLKKLYRRDAEEELDKDTFRELNQEYKEAKERAIKEKEDKEQRLDELPDPEEVRQEAGRIRDQLLQHYSSPEHLHEMTFEEKKRLLHWLFDGSDRDGKEYGIYVDKEGFGNDSFISFSLHGRLTDQRTVKDDDNDSGNGRNSSTPNSRTSHKNSGYKTNNFTSHKKEHLYHHEWV